MRLIDIHAPPATSPAARDARNGPSDLDVAPYLPSVLRERVGASLPHWLAELQDRQHRVHPHSWAGAPRRARPHAGDDRSSRGEGGPLRRRTPESRGRRGWGFRRSSRSVCPVRPTGTIPGGPALAALDLQGAAGSIGLSLSCGIASGDVFCGAIGTEARAEYTVLGEAVNRAARLSVVAAGRVLADDMTAELARSAIVFDGPWTMQVSGIRAPLSTFVALRPRHRGAQATREPPIGRAEELTRLHVAVDRAVDHGSSLILVEGEAGVGKSALVAALVADCRQKGRVVLEGGADDLERDTPYFAFRRMAARRAPSGECARQRRARARRRRTRTPPGRSLHPRLLNDVLELGLQEADGDGVVGGSVRADNLRNLLATIVAEALGPGPSVLVFEDVHWLDPSSRSAADRADAHDDAGRHPADGSARAISGARPGWRAGSRQAQARCARPGQLVGAREVSSRAERRREMAARCHLGPDRRKFRSSSARSAEA